MRTGLGGGDAKESCAKRSTRGGLSSPHTLAVSSSLRPPVSSFAAATPGEGVGSTALLAAAPSSVPGFGRLGPTIKRFDFLRAGVRIDAIRVASERVISRNFNGTMRVDVRWMIFGGAVGSGVGGSCRSRTLRDSEIMEIAWSGGVAYRHVGK